MFRPEMLEAMGLPKDVKVHGWGLSLERYPLYLFKRCGLIQTYNDHDGMRQYPRTSGAQMFDRMDRVTARSQIRSSCEGIMELGPQRTRGERLAFFGE